MHLPWKGSKCIVCLQQERLHEEHLIPKALGGRLTCSFLCHACNSGFGHALEAAAISDPAVLLAVKKLSKEVPELSKRLVEKHPHIGHSERGIVPGYLRDGEFHVTPRRLEDGSLVQGKDEARRSIVKMLRRSGQDRKSPIEHVLAAFDEAREKERTRLAAGLDVTHWTVDDIQLDLKQSRTMSLVLPVKMAFEFLAVSMGSVIYGNDVQLSEVRESLTTFHLDGKSTLVERRHSGQYRPLHGIWIEQSVPYVVVQIRLFGWLAFRVHFLRLCSDIRSFVYTHMLDPLGEYVGIVDD